MTSQHIPDSLGDNTFKSSDLRNFSCSPVTEDNLDLCSICKELQKCIFTEEIEERDIFSNKIVILNKHYKHIFISIQNEFESNPDSALNLNEILNSLQDSINVLSCIRNIFESFSQLFDVQNLQSLPVTVCDILLITYQHCKKSDNIYGSYFKSVSGQLTTLFKKTSELQTSFLNALTNKLKFDLKRSSHITILVQVMESLEQIGETVTVLDIKTSVELWKTFLLLSEKHSEVLIPRLNVALPVNFLVSGLETSLNSIFINPSQQSDAKAAEKTLKLMNFNLKVLIKMCKIFRDNSGGTHKKLLELLILLNRYCVPYLKLQGVNARLIELIETYLIVGTEPLVTHLITDREFVNCYLKNIALCFDNDETRLASLFLTVTVLKKIMTTDVESKKQWMDCDIINVIFSTVEKCHAEFMLPLKIPVPQLPGEPNLLAGLYEYFMLQTAAFIVTFVKTEQFSRVEKLLVRSILQADSWKAMLASDIWCILVRYGSVELCYEQLIYLIRLYERLQDCQGRAEEVYLGNIASRLYSCLNDKYKTELMRKYPAIKFPKIWTMFKKIKHTLFNIDDILKTTVEKVESFLKNQICNVVEFKHMCALLELVATFANPELQSLYIPQLVLVVVKLWLVNSDERLKNSSWFQNFTKVRSEITVSLTSFFSDKQILQVLQVLVKLKDANERIKLCITRILYSLGTRKFCDYQEQNRICDTIAKLFKTLLNDVNPIVKQRAFEVFRHFGHQTVHESILTMTFEDDSKLHEEMSKFLQKIESQVQGMSASEYYKMQNLVEFKHKCEANLSIVDEPLQKKIKMSSDINYDVIVQRFVSDTELMVEYCKENELPDETQVQIVKVIAKLRSLVRN